MYKVQSQARRVSYVVRSLRRKNFRLTLYFILDALYTNFRRSHLWFILYTLYFILYTYHSHLCCTESAAASPPQFATHSLSLYIILYTLYPQLTTHSLSRRSPPRRSPLRQVRLQACCCAILHRQLPSWRRRPRTSRPPRLRTWRWVSSLDKSAS